jgi:CRP/FNR family transcriptional regulator, anaerobic regulatory protein
MPMTATAGTSFGSFRPFSLTAGTGARKANLKLRRRHAADPANEAFEAHRRAIVCAGNHAPLERVAAFLVAISKNNRHEGRHPNAIPDSLTCGFVADLLGFPIATLGSLLKILEERGLVAPDAQAGLLLKDLPGLETLARA